MEEKELYDSPQEEANLNTENQTDPKVDEEIKPTSSTPEDQSVEEPIVEEKQQKEVKKEEDSKPTSSATEVPPAEEPMVEEKQQKEEDKETKANPEPTSSTPEDQSVEEKKEQEENEEEEEDSTTSDEDSQENQEAEYDSLSREEMIVAFKELLKVSPIAKANKKIGELRSSFEKATEIIENEAREKFVASGEPAELFIPQPDQLQKDFSALILEYRTQREADKNRLENTREENLKAKNEVIEGIKDLLNRQESLNETFQEFRNLQQKWHDIGQVPQNQLHDLWENYHHHVENFYNYIKINNELRDLDLKKNQETKTNLCEKAEALLIEPSVVKAFKTLQKYHDQWRETGPVPHDKKEELWDRFKAATTKINQRQQEHFESLRHQLVHNLEAKNELCQKAEELSQLELKSPREWEDKSKILIDLQQVWKTIGFAPKKENNAVYERFRTACDTFFNQKREFFKSYKDKQNNNLQLKTELCIQAESMMESEDWRKTTQAYIEIQKKWKEIGPVARKQSDAIWKRFRGACDHFFDRKSHFFKHIDERQDENLKLKEEIIEKVNNFVVKEDNEENAIAELQKFQKEWIEIGFVPIKDKDRVNQEFRNIINQKFDHLNLDEEDKSLQKYRNKLESWKLTNQFNEKIGSERHKLASRLKQLEGDIILWENNIGFFSKSKKSEALMRDFQNKIEDGKLNIELMIKKLEMIEEMI
ncbi:MAG TPA: DUF349 domain-containing protein [Marinilabiliaceae bacterium]|nr:DUF349 domain-containing protein [Marinilabiliaceae bacterium]